MGTRQHPPRQLPPPQVAEQDRGREGSHRCPDPSKLSAPDRLIPVSGAQEPACSCSPMQSPGCCPYISTVYRPRQCTCTTPPPPPPGRRGGPARRPTPSVPGPGNVIDESGLALIGPRDAPSADARGLHICIPQVTFTVCSLHACVMRASGSFLPSRLPSSSSSASTDRIATSAGIGSHRVWPVPHTATDTRRTHELDAINQAGVSPRRGGPVPCC